MVLFWRLVAGNNSHVEAKSGWTRGGNLGWTKGLDKISTRQRGAPIFTSIDMLFLYNNVQQTYWQEY